MRHGRTEWNAGGRFQGQTDVALDPTGRTQARALAAFLAEERFDAYVSSDLARARETAEAIAGRSLFGGELDPDWREMAFGAWEGLTWEEIVARFPELAVRPANVPRFTTPHGGESFECLCTRVERALATLLARVPPGGKALAVTHAGVLHALLRTLLGAPEADALSVRFVPASVTRFAFGESGARLLTLNVTAPEADVA